MKGTVAPSSSSSTAAAIWLARTPSSVASKATMRALSTPAATFVITEVSDISIRRQKEKQGADCATSHCYRTWQGGPIRPYEWRLGRKSGAAPGIIWSFPHTRVLRQNRRPAPVRTRSRPAQAASMLTWTYPNSSPRTGRWPRPCPATSRARADRAGAGHRPGHPGPRHARRRGRHRHRQDLGLPCTRLHPGRQGADFHRHPHAAGPVVFARSAARARRWPRR